MDFGRLNIAYLKKTTDNMLCKILTKPLESGGYVSRTLFNECRVDQDKKTGEWFVEIEANAKTLPFMFKFKEKYFKYEL